MKYSVILSISFLFCLLVTAQCCGNLRKRTLPTRPPPPPPPPGECGTPSVSLSNLGDGDYHSYLIKKNSSKVIREITGNEEKATLSSPETLVIGGVSSKAGQWPWQAALYRRFGSFTCGATLINSRWLVTAAHCMTSLSWYYSVVLGDTYRGYNDGREQTRFLTRYINHPLYSASRTDYDISLIQLSSPVNFTTYIKPVCLPQQGEDVTVGSTCYISGWGKTSHPGSSTNFLQHASMNVISNTQCQETNKHIKSVTNRMVCARNGNGRQMGCHGDSGGPFVCQQGDGKWKLHGAVSWGSPTCNSKLASTVFARISFFRNWIDETMARYN